MFSVSNKAPTRLGCGFKADQMGLNFVLEFSTLFLWPQDCPHDEMSEEEETQEFYDIKKTQDRSPPDFTNTNPSGHTLRLSSFWRNLRA